LGKIHHPTKTHTHWLPLVQRILEGKFPQKSPYFKGEKKVEMAKCFQNFYFSCSPAAAKIWLSPLADDLPIHLPYKIKKVFHKIN
jgi:hypothetical protein